MASALLYWHWEAMLVSYLATRKTVLPFHTLSEMYENTDFRLALIPSTSFEDSFKYSTDPLWQKIFKERLQPHLQEYSDYPDHLSDMVSFLRNDYKTALYDGVIVLRYVFLDQDLLNQTFLKLFSNFSCMFLNPNNFSNFNFNCSNLLDMRNLQEQVKKAFCYQTLF